MLYYVHTYMYKSVYLLSLSSSDQCAPVETSPHNVDVSAPEQADIPAVDNSENTPEQSTVAGTEEATKPAEGEVAIGYQLPVSTADSIGSDILPAEQETTPKEEEREKTSEPTLPEDTTANTVRPATPVMEDSAESDAIPIPKGSYNLDFLDHLDENINPFQSKSKIGSSPPVGGDVKPSQPPVEFEDTIDPFKTKNNMASSPPQQDFTQPPAPPVPNKGEETVNNDSNNGTADDNVNSEDIKIEVDNNDNESKVPNEEQKPKSAPPK